MFTRRRLLGAGASAVATGALLRADVPDHLWQGYDFGPGPKVTDRLNQGPFPVEQDQGWRTLSTTTPSAKPVRNFGLGLCGYTWEESGPSLAARAGRQTLENHVEAHGFASVRGRAVHPLRLAGRPNQTRQARSEPGVEVDAGRSQSSRQAGGVSSHAVQHGLPAEEAGHAGLSGREGAGGRDRTCARSRGRYRISRAALRPSGVFASLSRAQ